MPSPILRRRAWPRASARRFAYAVTRQSSAPPAGGRTRRIMLNGRLFTTWGPRDAPIRWAGCPPALDIVADPVAAWPVIGSEFPVGQLDYARGPVATFRL